MGRTVGVSMTDRLAVGLVDGARVVGEVRYFPDQGGLAIFQGMPSDEIAANIMEQISLAAGGERLTAVGVGLPGIVRHGVVEESPNLIQMKGLAIEAMLAGGLGRRYPDVRVAVSNDADAMAAGIAATRGQLDRLVRVWTLGNGVGFGRYPAAEGVFEGGHTVVTLDPKETYCGCGGVGHLEGIMGHRAMRLRFLDLEPEEIFESARTGVARCMDFVKLWHRALAAGAASSIHMDGPGKFYLTGQNAHFVDVDRLHRYMSAMVKMSPLQGYSFEVVPGGEDIAIIGAAVAANSLAATA
ncbi:MAG: ROK family protein [Acidobacteria bacterium]|nr:ROK family protein [Acidobacteriota bacterium]